MAGHRARPQTSARVILEVLADEIGPEERSKTEEKIRRRLRYYKLGPYQQERVDLLRRFKAALQAEIERFSGSQYYLGPHGKCAALEDFNVERMTTDCRAQFPEIEASDIEWFVPWALYLYYLR